MRERWLVAILLVSYGWLFVYFERINNPNELVRVYAARALLTERTWAIGRREASGDRYVSGWGYVNDKALVCDDKTARPPRCTGTLYAAKAPGAALLGAPIAALTGTSKTRAVFALRWILGILPSVAFWIVFRRFLLARGVASDVATAATLAGGLGSLSLTYGQMFAGHQLAAVALGGAYLAGFWPGKERPALFGLLAALAVAVEYPCAPAAALLAIFWLAQRRPRPGAVARAIAGALPPALALLRFHWSAFGSPFSTPYSHLENLDFARDISPGFLGISPPTWERVTGSLFAPAVGLLFWAPWIGLAFAARKEKVAWAVVVYYLVFQVTHALWRGGWVVGPRYVTPMVPFAAAAFALDCKSFRVFCGAAAAAICATGLASAVCQGFPTEVRNPLREVVWPLWTHGYAAPNLLQFAGIWSTLPYLAALLAAIVWLLRKGGARGFAVFAVLTLIQWAAPARDDLSAARYLASQWQPAPPPGAKPF